MKITNQKIIACTVAISTAWTCVFLSRVAADEPSAKPHSLYRSPVSLALSPDGNTLYVSDRTAGNVSILDVASKTKRGEIALQGQPAQLALSADGGTLNVAQRGAGTVAVIDTKTNAVSARIRILANCALGATLSGLHETRTGI